MQNNNYLSLINFKVKLHHQRLFFMNEHDIGCSISSFFFFLFFFLNIQHYVHL